MSTTVFYRKGKGPNRDGTTLAERYAAIQQATLDNYNPKGAHSKRLAQIMAGSMVRAAPSIASGFGIGTREIDPMDGMGTPILSTLSVAYASSDHIGEELMPRAPVNTITGEYEVYPRRDGMQLIRGKGRGKGRANEITISTTTQAYATVAHDHTGKIGLDAVLAQSIASGQAPLNRLVRLVNKVGRSHADEKEVEIAEIMTTAANYGTDNKVTLASGSKWDESGAEISKVVQNAKRALWNGEGSSELVAWTSAPVWDAITRDPSMLSLLSANDRGLMTPEIFANVHDLDGVVISDLRLDSANIAAAEDPEYVWGNFFGICRVSRTPQLGNASFGYTLHWDAPGMAADGLINAQGGLFTNMWFDPSEGPLGSHRYKVAAYYTPELVAADTGYLVSSCLATFP